MNSRGSQEIVLGTLALQAKIIDEPIFVGLIVMTVITILMAGPVMKYYLAKEHALSLRGAADTDVPLAQASAPVR
jgi:Kef-type K+ transport system membrane component KefB